MFAQGNIQTINAHIIWAVTMDVPGSFKEIPTGADLQNNKYPQMWLQITIEQVANGEVHTLVSTPSAWLTQALAKSGGCCTSNDKEEKSPSK